MKDSYTIEGYTVKIEPHASPWGGECWVCNCPGYKGFVASCRHVFAVLSAQAKGKEPDESGPKVVPIRKP